LAWRSYFWTHVEEINIEMRGTAVGNFQVKHFKYELWEGKCDECKNNVSSFYIIIDGITFLTICRKCLVDINSKICSNLRENPV
jgi:hypothetical protein